MTKIFRSSFYRTKQADPLGEEEESLMAAGEYRDLESAGGNKDGDGDETAITCADGALVLAAIVSFPVSAICIYYVLLATFYSPPEAGADGGGLISKAGAALLAVGIVVLAGTVGACCRWHRARASMVCCRCHRGRASAASAVSV